MSRAWLRDLLFPVPAHLAANQRGPDPVASRTVAESVKRHYHVGWRSPERYSPEGYRADLEEHTDARLWNDRRRIIPWLDSVRALRGQRILEIGCGTGSATVALAEQGARVIAIDVDEGALAVARDRRDAMGLDADLRSMNATGLDRAFEPGAFDAILFFASLEHMLLSERLAALAQAWALLPKGGLLAVIETPNRLWHTDWHTSRLPFFQWLPDDLALRYSRRSPRENFREAYGEGDEASREHFLRRGRGVSFHEFDLSIGAATELQVAGRLSSFQPLRRWLNESSFDRRFRRLLAGLAPDLDPAFLDPSLDLVILKN